MNFLFEVISETINEGEMFFVQAKNIKEAGEIAREYFPDEMLAFRGKYTDFEAEWYPYDTY